MRKLAYLAATQTLLRPVLFASYSALSASSINEEAAWVVSP